MYIAGVPDMGKEPMGVGYTPIVRTLTASGTATAPVVSGTGLLKQPYASGQTLSASITVAGVVYAARCTCAIGSTSLTFTSQIAAVTAGTSYPVLATATVTVVAGPSTSVPLNVSLTWR